MNCPSRTEEPPQSDGLNQSPNALSNDLTTNQDLNGMVNARRLRRAASPSLQSAGVAASMTEGCRSRASDDPGGRRTEKSGSAIPVVMDVGAASALNSARDSTPSSAKTQTQTRTRTQAQNQEATALSSTPGASSMQPGQDQGSRLGGSASHQGSASDGNGLGESNWRHKLGQARSALLTFYKFVGPGFIISVAYIDPGNYSTDIAAGASYRFRLLFVVLVSNIFAIFLQSLAIKLGTVTGRNLAEACRAFLPRWLNLALYVLAEVAIIATDIAEVIGTAIALNMLSSKIPLVVGCAISIVDVLLVLMFCRPDSDSMRSVRLFECLVAPLVIGVVVCFCIQLSFVHKSATVGAVFHGYLPSSALIQRRGLYQACGILGATVMPHSLYLGSGLVQSRLREFDAKAGLLPGHDSSPLGGRGNGNGSGNNGSHAATDSPNAAVGRSSRRWFPFTLSTFFARFKPSTPTSAFSPSLPATTFKDEDYTYIPSLRAIRHSLKYSVAELALCLFTMALFVNSSILIVAGAALYNEPDAENADIYAIHQLLSSSISPAAGTIFALALLLSGLSAGLVCTIAGQMVSEGALRIKVAPWLRRLLTRSISITPSIIIAGAVGRTGLDTALNATQVALSVVLPFVTAPLIWFTCFQKYMTVQHGSAHFALRERSRRLGDPRRRAVRDDVSPSDDDNEESVNMANSWPVVVVSVVIWLIITAMNIANLALLGKN